jgi:hypothetical protein
MLKSKIIKSNGKKLLYLKHRQTSDYLTPNRFNKFTKLHYKNDFTFRKKISYYDLMNLSELIAYPGKYAEPENYIGSI